MRPIGAHSGSPCAHARVPDRSRTAAGRVALLWITALGTTVAATAAAVVAWQAGLGQEVARVAEVPVIAACAGVGALILTSRPRQPVGRALLAGGASWGLAALPVELLVAQLHVRPTTAAAALLAVAFTVRGLGWMILAVVLPLVFPDGATRGARRWLRLALVDLALFAAMMLAQPVLVDDRLDRPRNPLGLPQSLQTTADGAALVVVALSAVCLVAGLLAVGDRWRHGTALVRQQVGWFAIGLLVTLAGIGLLVSGVLAAPVFALAVAGLPVAVGVAVLQHRLYEVDVLVNRALLYALLTMCRRRRLRAGRGRRRRDARPAGRRLAALGGNRGGRRGVPAAARGHPGRGQPAHLRRLERAAGAAPLAAHPTGRRDHARSARCPTSSPSCATRCASTTCPSPTEDGTVAGHGRRRAGGTTPAGFRWCTPGPRSAS